MVKEKIIAEYRKKHSDNKMLVIVIILISVILAIYALSLSQIGIDFLEALSIFIKHLSGEKPTDFISYLKDRIVFEENGPRAIGALCAGATLAVAGAVLQNIIRNPLADPYTLGISSGALFGMLLAVTMGISIIPFMGELGSEIANAFIFALIPTTVVITISAFKKVSPTMMILCGIAVMYIFNGASTLMKYYSDPETYSMVFTWSIGSVSGLAWGSLPKLAGALILILIPMMIWHRKIDIISQGDNQAITLGINPNRMRIYCFIVISVATALTVCYTGTIGFVGLVAPHIARIFVGANCRDLIPASAAIGGLMVLGSDVAIRLIDPSLPVGVMIAVICSPIFILVLARMNKKVW